MIAKLKTLILLVQKAHIRNGLHYISKLYRFEQLNVISQLCYSDLDVLWNFTSNYDGTNFIQILKNLAPNLNDTFLICAFLSENFDFDAVHSPIITDAGLCYTFNGLSGEEIFRTVEFGALNFAFHFKYKFSSI